MLGVSQFGCNQHVVGFVYTWQFFGGHRATFVGKDGSRVHLLNEQFLDAEGVVGAD